MPRNPHKTRCQVPGCRNWAMRAAPTAAPTATTRRVYTRTVYRLAKIRHRTWGS